MGKQGNDLLDIIIESIDKDKEEIVEKWIEKQELNSFSKKMFNRKSKGILTVFGKKILEHLFDIISDDKAGIFDAVTIIIDYFLNKNFNLVDMYRNYADLKNVTLFYYIEKFPELKDKFYYPLANLFDKNFTIFINEFLSNRVTDSSNNKQEKSHKKYEYSLDEIEKEKSYKEKDVFSYIKTEKKLESIKKDIRFTKKETVSATEFVEDLDYTVFDKVDSMLEDVDDLMVLLYSLEDSNNTKKSIEIIEKIKQYLDEIPELLVSLGVFEIIERSFAHLIEFLSTITEEMLQDKDKKSLLVNLLLALINDFENWLKVIFIDKSAQDIHYFDASFRANILKIENIFTEEDSANNDEKEECEMEFF
jgi:hypothetical protein